MYCIICKNNKEENLVIFGKNICSQCEHKLIDLPVEDEAYDIYREAIKDMLSPIFAPPM